MTATEVTTTAVLELRSVEAAYGRTVALRDIDLRIPEGTVVGLLGANGAGKTTLLRVAAGLLRPTKGQVMIDGKDAGRLAPCQRAHQGLCLIPEGRGIFRALTVRENLELFVPPGSKRAPADIGPAVSAFPILGSRLKQVAGSLSGGEQQMLAVAKAYLAGPRLVMADELSMGLGPMVVDQIYDSLQRLNAEGVALLIVEQYVNRILEMADDVYLLSRSHVAWSGPSKDVDEESLVSSYLGDSA
jgi:branched-chain amino acid transport system ATP-binding protein